MTAYRASRLRRSIDAVSGAEFDAHLFAPLDRAEQADDQEPPSTRAEAIAAKARALAEQGYDAVLDILREAEPDRTRRQTPDPVLTAAAEYERNGRPALGRLMRKRAATMSADSRTIAEQRKDDRMTDADVRNATPARPKDDDPFARTMAPTPDEITT